MGFGPGDPGLLTVNGLEKLQLADIIYYDDLTNKEYLANFKAEKIYTGKRKNNHSHSQIEINKLIYVSAIAGKNTVRLKGGDPMLFAHGGEETEYLLQNLVDVDVVPGITAALATSSLTKIPLTHRDVSSSVTFLSGHSVKDLNIPCSGTIVVYMGGSNLRLISEAFINKGWNPDTPVLSVYNVSLENQEESITTLRDASANEPFVKTPVIILIGEVIKLKYKLAEEIKKPLFLVTGTSTGSFSKYGKVHHLPFICIKQLENYEHVQPVIDNLQKFNWIVFTSRYAVRYFFKALLTFKKDLRTLAVINIASIGKTTTSELSEYGIYPELQSEDESSEGLIELFSGENIINNEILIPRSNIALPLLPDGLKQLGNKVTTLTIYENTVPDNLPEINPGQYDYIVFNSPSCVENFFIPNDNSMFTNQKFIVRGPQTMKILKNYNFNDRNILTKEYFELTQPV